MIKYNLFVFNDGVKFRTNRAGPIFTMDLLLIFSVVENTNDYPKRTH